MSLSRSSALVGLLGLGISLYLTVVHYAQGQVPLACVTTGLVNCDQVISSSESMVGRIPVAVLGVVWFAVNFVLAVSRAATRPRLAWTAAGVAFVFYLVYAELFLIGAICLWCTAVHLLVIASFLLAIAESSMDRAGVAT